MQHHGPCPHSAEGKLEPWIISELHIDYNVILFFVSMELYDSIWAEGNSEILIIKYLICYWAKIVLELNLNPKWLFKKNNFSMLILLRREPAGILWLNRKQWGHFFFFNSHPCRISCKARPLEQAVILSLAQGQTLIWESFWEVALLSLLCSLKDFVVNIDCLKLVNINPQSPLPWKHL